MTPALQSVSFRCPHCSGLMRLSAEVDPKPTPKPPGLQRGDRVRFLNTVPGVWRTGDTGTVTGCNPCFSSVLVSVDNLRRRIGLKVHEYEADRSSVALIQEATA